MPFIYLLCCTLKWNAPKQWLLRSAGATVCYEHYTVLATSLPASVPLS